MATTGKLRAGVVMRTAEDWEEAALDAIASGGVGSVAIPELARSLGVTKGSFYWHFQNLQALIAKALHRWEAADATILEELSETKDPRERLAAAFHEAMLQQRAHALYVTLATSAHAQVPAALRRVADRRIDFLVAAYRDLGFAPQKAHVRAQLAYAAYIGLLHLRRQSLASKRNSAQLDAFVAHAIETLIPPSASTPS
jgi:AcrR family transcriptional regulator